METRVIAFDRNKDEFGWLSNMSPYPVTFAGKEYRTTEALFQALRFKDEEIQELIRAEKSPMSAKAIMNENLDKLVIAKHSERDINNMKLCIKLKLEQHPYLKVKLLETGDAWICENVTRRGDNGGNLVWGSMLVGEEWVGQNILGNIWMEMRKNLATLENKR